MHVSLTPKLEALVRDKVDSGLYNNASEVIREALRLMNELDSAQELKLKRLRKELAKGEADLAAGRKTIISDDEELRELFARL
jgi:antitoxin ParD1/3/4